MEVSTGISTGKDFDVMDDSVVTHLQMSGALASSPSIQQPVYYSQEGTSDPEKIVCEDQRVPSICESQEQSSRNNTFPQQTVDIASNEAPITPQPLLLHSSPLEEAIVQGNRSSLDEILRYANKGSNGGVFDVANEPLSPSPSTSLPSKDSLETETGHEPRLIGTMRETRLLSSYGMLVRHENSSFAAPALAETIPLPASEPDIQPQPRSSYEQSFQLDAHDPIYFDMVQEAAESIENLKSGRILKLRPLSRHDNINISYVDYFGPSRSRISRVGKDNISLFSEQLGNPPSDITQRLIVVEDLCPSTIEFIGTRFRISPEFFEEHLINSGYGSASYTDASARSWKTSSMKKSHVSIKWYRPAWRLPIAPYSKSDLKKLLTRGGLLNDARNISKSEVEATVCQIQPNIFRSEWDLWMDPKTTTHMKRLCGWEESASLWIGMLPNSTCRVGRTDDEESQAHSSEDRQNKSSIPKRWAPWFTGTSNDIYEGPRDVITTLRSSLTTVIEQTVPRLSLESSLEEAFFSRPTMQGIGKQLKKTASTHSCFRNILGFNSEDTGSDSYFGVLMPLFEVIQQDVTEFLTRLHQVLDTINSEVLDDIKMENQLPIWRQLITRAQLELPELQRSLANFFSFLPDRDKKFRGRLHGTAPRPDEASSGEEDGLGRLQELSQQIEDTIKMVQRVSNSLISNMALLDSRRSIAEAHSVTKLTELAFFFIPLTFAESLFFFGMQIEEFEQRSSLIHVPCPGNCIHFICLFGSIGTSKQVVAPP
ncbi:hypothetical protein N431DRAFT_561211 [Stipitochalara longipes BDJ]|nr:hypothetical protein N431DRAFT_561211 [Stipitochalara longipes BDJ]